MNHYQLTIDNLQPVTFWADNSQLKYQLNSAYIAFKNKHNGVLGTSPPNVTLISIA